MDELFIYIAIQNYCLFLILVEEAKKRWRSLRDAFMKQYKQLSVDDPCASKKKKWLFYDQMEFLGPFLELNFEMKKEEKYDTFCVTIFKFIVSIDLIFLQ